jgi:hypothetical protein
MDTHDITANSKPVRCALIVSAAVARRKICKFLICCFTSGLWEHFIVLTTVDQERDLALLDVNLL